MSVSDNCTDHCFHRFKYNANSTDNIRVDKMNIKTLLVALSLTAGSAFAQTADPIIMTIGGKNITRSEFEYAYIFFGDILLSFGDIIIFFGNITLSFGDIFVFFGDILLSFGVIFMLLISEIVII